MEEQAVIEQVEAALDSAVETVVPEVVETVTAVRNNPVILAGVAIVGLSIGAFAGYKFAEKRLAMRFDELLEHEVAQAREFYSARFEKTGEFATPEAAVEALMPEETKRAMTDYHTISVTEEVAVSDEENGVEVVVIEKGDMQEVVKSRNIFVDGKPIEEFDYEAEVAKRTEDRPYVITEEEYFQNEPDFEQLNFTYYEGDGVLCDERDDIVNDTENTVGDENLQRFGHGTSSRHTVYVRNNKRGHDYEIARSRGKYTVEVLGLEDEDARTVSPRKFRGGDD